MKIAVVGQGAFGQKHLDAIAKIGGIDVVTLCGGRPATTEQVALARGIPHWTTDLDDRFGRQIWPTDLADSLAQPGVEAAILASPTPLHASQAIQCLRAGKHVQIEIPMADSLADAERVVAVQKETGLVAMAGHTRRFNPSHQWIHKRIVSGALKIQQMDVQTYFFRRTNTNALGQPRSWTDHLLWHHACHTVDLFQYQTGEIASRVQALEGPIHPTLGIAMDMSIGMKVPSGAICTLSLSFNNDGRWERSSAISATMARTSLGTTTCLTARSRKSTCRRSMFR
jgi:2-hydroxy-4-carboxymuconate semialdehyde hemiacetal dehydrogenase